jgi:hypothetical protein
VTQQGALQRIEKLMAKVAPRSGATEEETRTAAVIAVRSMLEHGLLPGGASPSSAIDIDHVAGLAFRVLELEQLVAHKEAERVKKILENDRRWSQVVEDVRREERADARKRIKSVARKTVVQERHALAKRGGKARADRLPKEQRVEIAKAGARARWQKWRERHPE